MRWELFLHNVTVLSYKRGKMERFGEMRGKRGKEGRLDVFYGLRSTAHENPTPHPGDSSELSNISSTNLNIKPTRNRAIKCEPVR